MAAKKKAEKVEKPAKDPKSKAPTRDERANALREDFNKKAKGRATLMSASDYVLPYLTKRLPTGLLTLDIALRGGFPAGGLSQVIGRKNSGKSWLAWQVIRQLQHMLGDKMKVLLAMTEIPADRSQARLAGVKISMGEDYVRETNKGRVNAGLPPFTKEEVADLLHQVGQIDELHALNAEEFYDAMLQAIDTGVYHLIVFDSIGNVMSAAAQENESIGDKTYAGASQPNSMFLQKMSNMLTMKDEWGNVRDTCIFAINQVRDNLKDPNAKYKAPGGNLLEHTKLVDLYIESGSLLGNEEPVLKMTNEGMKAVKQFRAWGKQVNWTIAKGKAGMHEGDRGSYVYNFDIGNVDFFTDAIIAGLTYNVITGSGWYEIPDPANPNKILLKVQGRDNLIKALANDMKAKEGTDDEPLMDMIRDECFKRAGITINYEWIST